MLGTETVQLEEMNDEIQEQIKKIEERGHLSEQERINLEKSLKDEVMMLKEEIEINMQECRETKKMFAKIQKSVAVMVEMFKRSKFFLCVAQKMNYEDGITFSENNIVSYLAELEEYISSLITYTAFKRDDPNAAISTIPLDKLDMKDFSKDALKGRVVLTADQLPISVDINDPEVGGGDVDEDKYKHFNIIDPRELY